MIEIDRATNPAVAGLRPRMGPSTVATGGAKRNPWGPNSGLLPLQGQGNVEGPFAPFHCYVAYDAPTAYIETLGIGDTLPSLPLFLEDETDYIPAPLESSYSKAFAALPRQLKEELEGAATGIQ